MGILTSIGITVYLPLLKHSTFAEANSESPVNVNGLHSWLSVFMSDDRVLRQVNQNSTSKFRPEIKSAWSVDHACVILSSKKRNILET